MAEVKGNDLFQGLRAVAKRIGQRVPDLLFPPACPLCHARVAAASDLCPGCREELTPDPGHHCQRCGTPVAAGSSSGAFPESGCPACKEHTDTPDRLHCAFLHTGAARELVLGSKFRDRPHWITTMGRLLWEEIGPTLAWEEPEMIIPIPLHPRRLVWRRFNQAALLAREVASRLERPLVTNALFRIRMTPSQIRLNREERRRNMVGAFRALPNRVGGRSLLLVDDVLTTGATIRAASAALREAGAGRVVVACLCRADHHPVTDDLH
ncbi:MAG: ComF family protein [Magnetococcales bacterium]|nr:ComF family protein [Magnetococcales bacterium]